MKKKILILIILCFGLISCTRDAQTELVEIYKENGYYKSEYGKVSIKHWENFNVEQGTYEDIEELLHNVDHYVETISEHINRPNWKDVYIKRHGDDFELKVDIGLTFEASRVKGSSKYLPMKIVLNESLYDADRAPLSHELTHIMCPNFSSYSLSEGLAQYIQDKFGQSEPLFSEGHAIMPIAKETLLTADKELIDEIGNEAYPKTLDLTYKNYDLRKDFYNLSYSYVQYLIDEYGMDKFMLLYESNDLFNDYQTLFGKPYHDIKDDWIDYLENYISNE